MIETRSGGNGSPLLGMLEWLHLGEHAHAEHLLDHLRALGVRELRTGFSWADSHRPDGWEWFDWLIPRLSREVNLLPCLLYTPPSAGVAPRTSSPPRDGGWYAYFVQQFIERYGEHFEWVELWNEPNNLSEYDWLLDPGWFRFADMVRWAAENAHRLGKRTVLGGMSPVDPEWLNLMCDYGVVHDMDAVGIHGFPGAWEGPWQGWAGLVASVRDVLQQRGLEREVWVTETGYSTWRHDHRGQLRAFIEAAEAPAERVYWYSLNDLDPDRPTVSGFHLDDREYHFGVRYADGRPKTLHRLWAGGGLEAVRDVLALTTGQTPAPAAAKASRPVGRSGEGHVLVTGGAGFIGTNLAHRYASEGRPVLVYDNLDRPGVERNLAWLKGTHGDLVQVALADVRDRYALRAALRGASAVYHLAAQVAVTTSLVNPLFDHEVNVVGTMGLLEELRRLENPPPLVFTSTNKVYGALEDIALTRDSTRYQPAVPSVRTRGVGEERPLSFQSPYGCSKGAADQYVRDYAHTYDLPAVVFRMSCIYGPHQHGTEDQGWIAHFLIRAIQNRPISIFGDGMQVRDALYVDDLVDALRVASQSAPQMAGEVLNIGGGPAHTLSLLELLQLIEQLHGSVPTIRFLDWRVGDQRYYVSDVTRIGALTGWQPRVGIAEGVARLYHWLCDELAASGGCGRSGRLALLDRMGTPCDDVVNRNG